MNKNKKIDGDGQPARPAEQAERHAEVRSADETYVTELDYISTWDTLNYQPSDSFMNGVELMFEDGQFYPGENYPRGV